MMSTARTHRGHAPRSAARAVRRRGAGLGSHTRRMTCPWRGLRPRTPPSAADATSRLRGHRLQAPARQGRAAAWMSHTCDMAWIPPNSCFRGLVEKGGRGECCRGSVLPASVPRAVGGVQLMLGFQGGALPWCGVVKMLVKPGPGSRMASSSIVIGGCRTGTWMSSPQPQPQPQRSVGGRLVVRRWGGTPGNPRSTKRRLAATQNILQKYPASSGFDHPPLSLPPPLVPTTPPRAPRLPKKNSPKGEKGVGGGGGMDARR